MSLVHRAAGLVRQCVYSRSAMLGCNHGTSFDFCGSGSSPPRRRFRAMPGPQMGRRSAKIAGRKGSQDLRKSKVWGTIAKQVLQAAKAGGSSPESNGRLKEVLYQAKQLGVPRDIIDRNLKKAIDKDQADFTEIVYEAYGPSATGFVIECLTDNPNRTANAVRSTINRNGGKAAEKGSVLFNFTRKGRVLVSDPRAEDQIFEAAMEAGAEDMSATFEDDVCTGFEVLTAVEDFALVREKLRKQQLAVDEDKSGLVFVPLMEKQVDEESLNASETLLEKLLAVDDVDAVFTNCAGLET